MSDTFLSLTGWTWLDIVSLFFVFCGVAFAFWVRCKKPPVKADKHGLIPVDMFFRKNRLESKRKIWESAWEIMLIVGLAGELFAAFHNIPEISRLTNENLKLQKQLQPRTITHEQVTNFIY